MERPNNNLLVGLALGFSIALLAWLIAALLNSKAGEQAGALGAVVGGIVGAGGAILAVFLTLSRQRREDAAKVRAAIRTELTTYTKYVIGALEICKHIVNKIKTVPMSNASYISEKLIDPVIYPAVADRIALIRYPQAIIEFYMRVQEVRAMTAAMEASVADYSSAQRQGINIQPSDVQPVADALITALQLVGPVLADEDDTGTQLDGWVRNRVLRDIEAAIRAAQKTFPNAESFKNPLSY